MAIGIFCGTKMDHINDKQQMKIKSEDLYEL